jgi:hypothetical protein
MPTLTTDEVLSLWTLARPLLPDVTPAEFAANIANGRHNPGFTITMEPETIRLTVRHESVVLRRNRDTVSRR